MKLTKALDKAKKAREAKQPPKKSLRQMPAETPAQRPKKENLPEWVPPVYSESMSLQFDQNVAAENRCICLVPNAPEIDSYKVLRTKIQHHTRVNGWNTVMITSARPGEGKTLTAVNLALTFAKIHHQTVLLVDCDLRRQRVHQCLGIDSDHGLIDFFNVGRSLKDLIIWPGIDKLTLISGGKTITESAELMGSPKMKDLVEEMKNRYLDRYIFFDVPPVLSGADAIAFAPLVDAFVMVVEAGKTSTRDIEKSLESLPQEKFLGFVLNRYKAQGADKYGYYY